MDIRLDDLSGPDIARFLEEHIEDMKAASPPESKHALDLEGLKHPSISFWTLWDGELLVGCGALKELDPQSGEVKSMRTAAHCRRRGAASRLLQHILHQAEQRGYRQLSLETGSMAFFQPARALYERFGFEYCGPFADYKLDPNSVFMTKHLRGMP
ncbi:MAG: GNAT family N-acetyltransferase [Candidatus Competibacterales bacterium]